MKKLFKTAMIGAMVLGAQSMVFASAANTEKVEVKAATLTQSIESKDGKTHIENGVKGEEVGMTASVAAIPIGKDFSFEEIRKAMTEEEKAADFEKVKEMCEALNIKYDENTIFLEVYSNLTEDQLNKLVELDIIQEATMSTEAMVATEEMEKTEGIVATATVASTEVTKVVKDNK